MSKTYGADVKRIPDVRGREIYTDSSSRLNGEYIVIIDTDSKFPRGTKLFFRKGKLHRKGPFRHLPAVIMPDGTKQWWVHGRLHRKGRPAIVYPSGEVEYWENGTMTQKPTIKTRYLSKEVLQGMEEYVTSVEDFDREDVGSISEFFEPISEEFIPNVVTQLEYIARLTELFPDRCFSISANEFYVKDHGEGLDDLVRYSRETILFKYDPLVGFQTEINEGRSPFRLAGKVQSFTETVRRPDFKIQKSMVISIAMNPVKIFEGNPFGAEGGGGHQNALFIDNLSKVIYVFEPNGVSTLDEPSWAKLNLLRGKIIDHVRTTLETYGYGTYEVSFYDACPYGVQMLAADSESAIKKYSPSMLGGASRVGGYCLSWSLMLVQYALMNPYLTFEQVNDLLANRFTPGELAIRIDKFAGFIGKAIKNPEYFRARFKNMKKRSRRVLMEKHACQKLISAMNELLRTKYKGQNQTIYSIMSKEQLEFFNQNCVVPESLKGTGAEKGSVSEQYLESYRLKEQLEGLNAQLREREQATKPVTKLSNKEREVTFTVDQINSMGRKELQAAAKEYGIPANKSNEFIKEELIKRISKKE